MFKWKKSKPEYVIACYGDPMCFIPIYPNQKKKKFKK
jgi:hypothetical protein